MHANFAVLEVIELGIGGGAKFLKGSVLESPLKSTPLVPSQRHPLPHLLHNTSCRLMRHIQVFLQAANVHLAELLGGGGGDSLLLHVPADHAPVAVPGAGGETELEVEVT